MTTILAVDLASRLSAGFMRGVRTTYEFDSWESTPIAFAEEIAGAASLADLIVIEDVPYGISNQKMVKPVLRLQGIIIAELARESALERTVFLNPSTWQRALGVFGKDKGGTHDLAVSLGYTSRDYVDVYGASLDGLKGKERSKVRAQLKKLSTDYDDAFLIEHWARKNYAGIRDLVGVQEPSI